MGTAQSYNQTHMSAMAFLRESTGDAMTPEAAYAIMAPGLLPENRIPNTRMPEPGGYLQRNTLVTLEGFNEESTVKYPIWGMLRAVAVGGKPTKMQVYGLFIPSRHVPANDIIRTTPVLLFDWEGAMVEMPNPPGDCILTVLANAACKIYYSTSR